MRRDEALGVLRRGIEAIPDHAGLRVTAGALYRQMGNDTRAAEEYRAALIIDPGNGAAKSGLERLKGEGK